MGHFLMQPGGGKGFTAAGKNQGKNNARSVGAGTGGRNRQRSAGQ